MNQTSLSRGAWGYAANLVDPPSRRYLHDPVGWVDQHVRFPEAGLTTYQRSSLAHLVETGRESIRGPHGLGKTTLSALAVLWFALTRDAAGIDWKVPTTASAWRQLTHFLWPEIHKWARLINWERVGRPPLDERRELLSLTLKLRFGEAFAAASNNPALIEGAHADSMLYVFDEAKTISSETFDAAEGAFSGAGAGTGVEAFGLATSTPGSPVGRFYEIHARRPGLDDWHATHVTLEDAMRARRVAPEWAEQRKVQWGEDSAVYRNRVLGEFAAADEDGVIPLTWVESSIERWYEQRASAPTQLTAVGVDVARTGTDRTALALRHDTIITELRMPRNTTTTEVTGVTTGILEAYGGRAVVDVIGIGAGVVDQLREQGRDVVAFNASERTDKRDRTGELGFVNKRSAAWWNLRELLEAGEIALPPDDDLVGELTAPRWREVSGGRIQVESKDEIRKRLGRSTDKADAVIQAFWEEPVTGFVVVPVIPRGQTKVSHWKV